MEKAPVGSQGIAPDLTKFASKSKLDKSGKDTSDRFSKELAKDIENSSEEKRPTQKPRKSDKSDLNSDADVTTQKKEPLKAKKQNSERVDLDEDSTKSGEFEKNVNGEKVDDTSRVQAKSRQKTEAGESQEGNAPSVKAALQKVAKQLKSQGVDLQLASPLLGVLAGKYSAAKIESVPELVFTSPFVSGALGGDLAKFLSTPQSLEELADSVDLSQDVLDRVKEMGIDPMVSISPRELFSAFGLDTQKITSELINIRDRGPMEGLTSIITNLKKNAESIKSNLTEIPVVSGTPVRKSKDDIIRLPTLDPRTKLPSLSSTAKVNAESLSDHDRSRNQDLVALTMTNSLAPASPSSLANLSLSPQANIEADDKSKGLLKIKSSAELKRDPLIESLFIKGEQSSLDPFDAMSHQMTEQVSLKLEPVPSSNNLQAPPIRDLASEVHRLRLEGLNSELIFSQSKAMTPSDVETQDHLKNDVLDLSSDIADRLEIQVGSIRDEDRSKDSSSGREKDSLQDRYFEGLNHSTLGSKENKIMGFEKLMENVSSNGIERATNVKELMDKAQLMIHKNGGSMRIDMGGENPVSLAIRVIEGEVSLKVSTQSDTMRDLISSEIPRLQESLSGSNLRLTEVDLGRQLSSGSHERQRSDQRSAQFDLFNGQSGQSQQEQRFVREKEKLKDIADLNIKPVTSMLRNDLGKLLVRV